LKAYKIVLALCVTFAVLIAMHQISRISPRLINETVTTRNYDLRHTADPIITSDTINPKLTVEVSRGKIPDGYELRLYFRPSSLGDYRGEISFIRREMSKVPGQENIYEITLPKKDYGFQYEYYFLLEDSSSAVVASLPDQSSGKSGLSFWIRFDREKPLPLLVAHILVMLAAIMFVSLAFLTSLENLHDSDSNLRLGKQILWVVVFLLIGLFGLGVWLQYQITGIYWKGIPLGRDIATSAGLVVFCYWLIILLLLKGSAFTSNPSKNILPPMGARFLTVLGFLITVIMVLIPHNMGDF
jgi:hypothetical protein